MGQPAAVILTKDLYISPSLDNFGLPTVLDTNKLANIANSYNTCWRVSKQNIKNAIDFFIIRENYEYLWQVFNFDFSMQYPKGNVSYGIPLVPNPQGTNDNCEGQKGVNIAGGSYYSFDGIYEFYKRAKGYKLLKRYPVLEDSIYGDDYRKVRVVDNCNILKEALVALEAEKSNEITLYGIDSFEAKMVFDKISEYNSQYAMLACDDFIIKEQKKEDSEAAKKIQDDAFEKQKEASEIATEDIDNTQKYITYGGVGLAAVVFLLVLVKKLKK